MFPLRQLHATTSQHKLKDTLIRWVSARGLFELHYRWKTLNNCVCGEECESEKEREQHWDTKTPLLVVLCCCCCCETKNVKTKEDPKADKQWNNTTLSHGSSTWSVDRWRVHEGVAESENMMFRFFIFHGDSTTATEPGTIKCWDWFTSALGLLFSVYIFLRPFSASSWRWYLDKK